LEHKSSRS